MSGSISIPAGIGSSAFVNYKIITGSAYYSLGLGSEIATTWCHVGFETGSGWSTSNIQVYRRITGQSTPIPTGYTNLFNGNIQNGSITGSCQFYLENTTAEILVYANTVAGATGSIWWATVRN